MNLKSQSSRNMYVKRYFEISRQGKEYKFMSGNLMICSELARDEESQWSKYIYAASGHFIQMLVELHWLACTASCFCAHIRITELCTNANWCTALLSTWNFTSQVPFVSCSPLWFWFTSFSLCIIFRLNKWSISYFYEINKAVYSNCIKLHSS